MDYHELRVLVPAEFEDQPHHERRVVDGAEMAELVHDALAPVIAARCDETAPVIVVWERMVPVAASGGL